MNAVGYLRLRNRDRSKSLEYQEDIIRSYRHKNGLKILEIFSDNGQSSYTFDSPDFLALEQLDKERSRKKSSIERKIFQLEEKFIDNLLEHSVYQNWSRKLNMERSILVEELEISKAAKETLQFDIDNLLSDKSGLFGIYKNSNTEQKQILTHAIFRDTLIWEKDSFAASFFNPALHHNLKKIQKMISIKSTLL